MEQQHREQIDQNYDAFQRALGSILSKHRHQHALLRDRLIVGYFDSAGDAYRNGIEQYPDRLFSIQEVTGQPVDLGFWSHVRGS